MRGRLRRGGRRRRRRGRIDGRGMGFDGSWFLGLAVALKEKWCVLCCAKTHATTKATACDHMRDMPPEASLPMPLSSDRQCIAPANPPCDH
jgi:hypothetical protein